MQLFKSYSLCGTLYPSVFLPRLRLSRMAGLCRGFTKFNAADYVLWKQEGRMQNDGVNAKLLNNKVRAPSQNQAPLVLLVRRWPIRAYLRDLTTPVLSIRVGPYLGACLRLQGPLEARKPEHLFELPGTRCKEPVHA